MTKNSPISPLLTVATQDLVYFAIPGEFDLVSNELIDRHASFQLQGKNSIQARTSRVYFHIFIRTLHYQNFYTVKILTLT